MKDNRKILEAIVRPLLPVEPVLQPDVRRQVEDAVVDFVAAQIRDMPSYLRLPYGFAMIGFNWMAVRQYARTYLRLDEVKQRDYIAVWIHSLISVKRDFIKLIRSCALLSYYDHPLVAAALEEWARDGTGRLEKAS
ncbi:MAG: hypothetical protein JXQ75_24155 [Phycisphaerae bacterium]|nr:hypothetical protein [Phycisphaerae bacterium]